MECQCKKARSKFKQDGYLICFICAKEDMNFNSLLNDFLRVNGIEFNNPQITGKHGR